MNYFFIISTYIQERLYMGISYKAHCYCHGSLNYNDEVRLRQYHKLQRDRKSNCLWMNKVK